MSVFWKQGVVCVVACCLCGAAPAQEAVPFDFSTAHWIGVAGEAPNVLGFRRTVEVAGGAAFARLMVTADAGYELYVNGTAAGGDSDVASPEQYDLVRLLRPGRNVLAVRVTKANDHPGLLVVLRAIDSQGRLLQLVSDAAWKVAAAPKGQWTEPGYDDSAWAPASALARYGSGPWGRLTRMSATESRRAMEEVRLGVAGDDRPASAFKGEYVDAALAQRYTEYLGADRRTGRFRQGERSMPLLFIRYAQPKGANLPAQFDFDRFERDLDLLAANGLQIALNGFSWPDLLAADGNWRKVTGQPRGAGLPEFEYVHEVVGHALDRVQAHGLHALALLDYRRPLPDGVVPANYQDKFLIAPSLWQAVMAGQAKIAKHFAGRPVLAGYVTATDALPQFPSADDLLVREAYRQYLRDKHGDVASLRRNWGLAAALGDFAGAPLPTTEANDPSTIDFNALRAQLTVARLNEWADAMRNASPQQMYVVGVADLMRPLFDAGRLRVDLLGAFGIDTPSTAEGQPMPGYGDTVAQINAYRRMAGTTIAGVMGGRWGGELKGGHATRVVRHEWAATLEGGGAGVLAAPNWTSLVNQHGATAQDTVGLRQLGDLLQATSEPFRAKRPAVLLVRNSATALSNAPAPDERASTRLAEALDRIGVAYDVVAAEAVGGTGERYKVCLDDYQAVLVPSLAQLPPDRFFERLKSWVQTPGNGVRRLLVLGRWTSRNEYFQTQAEPAALRALAGQGGLPAVGRQEVKGNAVVVTDLSFTGAPGSDEGLVDKTVIWLANAFDSVRLKPVWTAPANVAVCFSDDGRRAIIRERLGSSSDVAWSQPMGNPPVVWSGGTTAIEAGGQQFASALAPYQVKVIEAVAEVRGVTVADTASVRTGVVADQPIGYNCTGPRAMTLRLRLQPQRPYWVATAAREPVQHETGEDGVLEVPVGPARSFQVASVPVRQPDPSARPDDYMAVGDYYTRRGEYAKAMQEYSRLEQDYAGTNVATLAAKRRSAILAECGVVVVVNLSKQPVGVKLVGPTPADGTVPPGQNQTYVVYAGQYQLQRQPIGGAALPAALAALPVVVAKGGVQIVEHATPLAAKPEQMDPKANLRGALTEAERTALEGVGKSQLAVAAPAPAGGAAGGAPAAGGGGEAKDAKSPGLLIVVESKTKVPTKPKGSSLVIRNLTKHEIEVTCVVYQAGVRPEQSKSVLKPRQRVEMAFSGAGTHDFGGKVISNGQDIVIGQLQNNGNEYECIIHEFTPEQYARYKHKKDQERLRGRK